jgi:hypothetical protein
MGRLNMVRLDMVRLWMRIAAVGCVLSAHAADLPGDELPKWVLDLSRIQRSMRTELKRLPNYTCAETIARYEGEGKHPHLIDRIETQVAVTRERELYSWQGGPFEERSIIDMVHEGFISDGDFSAMLQNVFAGRNARVSFMGEETLDDRKALRYRFEIPQAISQWVIRAGTAAGTVGARGSFWADAGTLDLLKMEFCGGETNGRESGKVPQPSRIQGLPRVRSSIHHHVRRRG